MNSGAMEHPEHLEVMEREECVRLLEARGVGRIGTTVEGRPAIYPVNYVVDGESIVFRVRQGGELDATTSDVVVAFEIDGADHLYHEGWSVLAVGKCTHIAMKPADAPLPDFRLTPWAGEDRDRFVRMELESLSGRRITHRAI